MANLTSESYQEERIRLLGRIVQALGDDERVVAAWLAGSLGRGTEDDLSDLDLWVVVEDVEIDEIIESPSTFVQTILPSIMEIAAPQNAPEGGAFLLTWVAGEHGPQQIDWYWQAAGRATRPAGTELLFQRQEVMAPDLSTALAADVLEREIDHMVRESLLMAFIAGKHVVRDDPWVTARHLVHVARCVGTVEWLIEHGCSPAHDDCVELRLPASIPTARIDQQVWIRGAIVRLTTRLASDRPGMLTEHAEALDHLHLWLEWIGGDGGMPSPASP